MAEATGSGKLPPWVTAVLASLCTLTVVLAVGLVIALHNEKPRAPARSTAASIPAALPTATVTVTATVTATASAAPTPKATPTTHPVVRPRGSASIGAMGPATNYGQGISYDDQCASWLIRLQNNSDLEVTGLTYRARSAEFDNSDFKSKPASRPAAVVLRLSVPAHTSQDVHFKSCTASHAPSGYDDYEEYSPSTVTLTYLYGYRQSVCFGDFC